MSRTKHTRPRQILALTRMQAPYEPRGHGDRSDQRRIARGLKEVGIIPEVGDFDTHRAVPLPRISIKRPSQGYYHPVNRLDIEQVLHFFGPSCYYGLRSIELRSRPSTGLEDKLLMGSLLVPGRIIIYEQPASPWYVPRTLPSAQRTKLCSAGARIEAMNDGIGTMIWWPEETLRDFILFDVLMHEVGHHLIQQYKGKRRVRVVRTRDHEAFADHFANDCRRSYYRPNAGG